MRYAVYFTPPADHPLTRTASGWLGRDAFSGEPIELEDVAGIERSQLIDQTADPRRYGFHATLKAPFELAEGRSEVELVEAFNAFCAGTQSVEIPTVVVGQLGPFFALVPGQPHTPLQEFAASIVRFFEPFRAPLSEADIARRKPETLSESRRSNLMQWGYPGVMDDFRFHMTLTGPIRDTELASTYDSILRKRFSEFHDRPLSISGLGLFREEERGEPFTVQHWRPLKGA